MWKIARRLLLLVCLLCTVSCHQKKHGHYHVVLKDHPETKLHDHICWVNKINQDSGSGHFGVKSYYECSIGKGYFAHLSDKIAKDIEESDEVRFNGEYSCYRNHFRYSKQAFMSVLAKYLLLKFLQ
jgi:hypothetical protein